MAKRWSFLLLLYVLLLGWFHWQAYLLGLEGFSPWVNLIFYGIWVLLGVAVLGPRLAFLAYRFHVLGHTSEMRAMAVALSVLMLAGIGAWQYPLTWMVNLGNHEAVRRVLPFSSLQSWAGGLIEEYPDGNDIELKDLSCPPQLKSFLINRGVDRIVVTGPWRLGREGAVRIMSDNIYFTWGVVIGTPNFSPHSGSFQHLYQWGDGVWGFVNLSH